MIRCVWLLLVACSSDPSLAITVHHPAAPASAPAARPAVAQTVVTVYFGGDIACSQIELGDRTDAELSAITVDEVDVTGGGSVSVSRLGPKAIVARGFDGQHRFVTAGCKDIGDIAGDTSVQIDTQPTAVVAVDPSAPDRPFAERSVLVNMTDVKGAAIDRTVSWLLSGPAGAAEAPPSAGIATTNGDATIEVADLGTPGPEGLRIRVPWATAPLPLVTGFDLSHQTAIPLGGGNATSHPSCDLRGHAGKPPTLVCLTQANAQLHRDAVEIAWQTDHYATTPVAIPAGPAGLDNQFALFVDHDGSADEPVYVISANPVGAGSWYKLGAAGNGTVTAFGDRIEQVVYIPRCKDNSVRALVAIQTGSELLSSNQQLFTAAGAPVTERKPGEVFSGGCVSDVDKREHQAVVVSGGNNEAAALVLITGAGGDQLPIPGARLTGSGFIAARTQGGTEKRFAGTRLQATGTVVFEAVLAPAGSSFKLVERSEREAAAPPTRILGGQLDSDGDTDLMWDMAAGLRRRVFQVSLAKQVSGARLTAMTSGPPSNTASTPADFLVGDLDGQQIDEMVLFTQDTVTIYSPDE
jgi:hypothetical protein